MYLVDTNVLGEILLGQERAKEARGFLSEAPSGSLHITDFSLYSIGIILTREERPEAFQEVLADVEATMAVLRARGDQLARIPQRAQDLGLDFDDAYQYTLAESMNLDVVSFDGDFDKTPRGRVLPEAALESGGG